jgi:hypothetical protein
VARTHTLFQVRYKTDKLTFCKATAIDVNTVIDVKTTSPLIVPTTYLSIRWSSLAPFRRFYNTITAPVLASSAGCCITTTKSKLSASSHTSPSDLK